VLRAFYGLLLSFGAPIGWMLMQRLFGRDPFAPENLDPLLYGYMTITTGIVFSLLGYLIGRREQMITSLALTDGLTALYNKRYFKHRLQEEFARHQRYGKPLSLIQIDLDHFKQINDRYGHHTGDEVLKKVASIVMANCRQNETAARVGGEELCIIAYDCTEQMATLIAERIRHAIESSQFEQQGQALHITASFGISTTTESTKTPWAVYQHADEALYVAKRNGRNRVMVYSVSQE